MNRKLEYVYGVCVFTIGVLWLGVVLRKDGRDSFVKMEENYLCA